MSAGTAGRPAPQGGEDQAARISLRHRLAELVEAAADRQVSAADAEQAESLLLLGVNSLTRLRLLDAVEREFDVVLEVDEGPAVEDNLDRLAQFLLDHGTQGTHASGGPR